MRVKNNQIIINVTYTITYRPLTHVSSGFVNRLIQFHLPIDEDNKEVIRKLLWREGRLVVNVTIIRKNMELYLLFFEC